MVVVVAEGFGRTGWIWLFADVEELGQGWQGGDAYADVLFEAFGVD